jgi:hypothetical protein
VLYEHYSNNYPLFPKRQGNFSMSYKHYSNNCPLAPLGERVRERGLYCLHSDKKFEKMSNLTAF